MRPIDQFKSLLLCTFKHGILPTVLQFLISNFLLDLLIDLLFFFFILKVLYVHHCEHSAVLFMFNKILLLIKKKKGKLFALCYF